MRNVASLNSLSGISLNATQIIDVYIVDNKELVSQFPLWDFGECNMPKSGNATSTITTPTLNSLCGISVNATGGAGAARPSREAEHSQFPLWDFGECNSTLFNNRKGWRTLSLNSLCGISVNATDMAFDLVASLKAAVSQFPLWDFGECNPWMGLDRDIGVTGFVALNSLCGISVNAT